MEDLLTYILWLQVFANCVSVVVTFMIGRLKIAPSRQWFTFCASLSMALLYRLIRVLTLIPSLTWVQEHKVVIIIIGDTVLLPLTAFFIMVFTIQIYKTVRSRNQNGH